MYMRIDSKGCKNQITFIVLLQSNLLIIIFMNLLMYLGRYIKPFAYPIAIILIDTHVDEVPLIICAFCFEIPTAETEAAK